MERSPMLRCAAVACVIAGGLLVGGSGAVAFADPADPSGPNTTDTHHDTGVDAAQPHTTPAPSSFGAGESPVYQTPTAGPVPAPGLDSPFRLGQLSLPDAKTPRWGPMSLPDFISHLNPFTWPGADTSTPPTTGQQGGTTPAEGTEPTAGSILPAGAGAAPNRGSAAETSPPTISLLPFVPPGVPVGPPMTIHNPLRDLLAPMDLHAPIVPQLLPPPVVAIVAAMSQQIPLTNLVLSPLMNDIVLPPLLSDVILPTLMSDVVVPTLQFGTVADTPVAGGTALRDPMPWSLSASAAPPSEIAPVGMDMPLAPVPSPPPLPTPGAADQAPQPNSTSPGAVAQLSEPVAFRAGYSDYLRNAGMAQITSLALPGIAGILLVTAGGGFIGYRQARAGHVIRAEGIARFLR